MREVVVDFLAALAEVVVLGDLVLGPLMECL